jgi:micrococcal nuclease
VTARGRRAPWPPGGLTIISGAALLAALATAWLAGDLRGPATASPAGPCTLPADARVTKVTDGDTVRVDLCGEDAKVRIIGLNTPETVDPRQPDQCFGVQASAYASGELAGLTVRLVPDAGAGVRDRYDRLLAYVEVDGRDYALGAIRAGYGEANDYGHRHARGELYAQAEAQARWDEVGAWGACPSPFKR